MAVYFPSTLFEARTMILPLSPTQRLEMEHAIEVAIALLDRADGDPELEEDELGDDDTDIRGEMDGYSEEALEYGIDQTKPIRSTLISHSEDDPRPSGRWMPKIVSATFLDPLKSAVGHN